jgi:uncharacterized caspase-like protein
VGKGAALEFVAASGPYVIQLVNNGPGVALCELLVQRGAARAEKYALLVGVRDYRLKFYQGTLKYTEEDVEDLARVLRDDGFARENIRVLSQWAKADNPALAPTSGNIRSWLEHWTARCSPDDTLVVAFSGSGVQYGAPPQYCFLPEDADLNQPESLLNQDELFETLNRCPARVKLLLLDTCQEALTPKQTHNVTPPKWRTPPKPAPGLAALFACSPGEISLEHDQLRHGIFSHFVLEGLRGKADENKDGVIRLDELSKFAQEGVRDFTKKQALPRQNPTLISALPSETPLVRLAARKD